MSRYAPSSLTRVYKSTTQRVAFEMSQLNSNAAYIITSYEMMRVILWIGSQCDPSDHTLAGQTGLEILREMNLISSSSSTERTVTEIESTYENRENMTTLNKIFDM